jgi:hypothetical protein
MVHAEPIDRLAQQPDAVAASDTDPADWARRVRSAADTADGAGGISTANPANRPRWIRSTANAANRARRISTANPADRAGGIRSYSTYHDVDSSQKI